ncbi:hypothetical protein ACTQV6_00845 [Holdemanella porci]|uniref:hypothetical protein n=1 Tax=Holdemanella porci TaxID=2652276 RepID=UPI003F8E6865
MECENILWAVTSGMARLPAFVSCIAGMALAMPGGTACRSIDCSIGGCKGASPLHC